MTPRRLLRTGLLCTGLLCTGLLLRLTAVAAELPGVDNTAPVESALTFERRTPDIVVPGAGQPGADQPGAGQPGAPTPFIRALDAFVPSQQVDTDQAVDFPTNI
jgi:hypothetical protein